MPAAPKSSSSKRGTSKTKGAVRAKSGCYTCRIRRKVRIFVVIFICHSTFVGTLQKCDEQHDDSGRCQTCVRLRLECLGFGAKRPEWLRVSLRALRMSLPDDVYMQESRNVTELREKIKGFLAAQGMIKGHSGSGPRSSDHEPPTLRLAEEYSDSSESPPTPTLSLSPDSNLHNTSSTRDEGWVPIISSGYNSTSSWYLRLIYLLLIIYRPSSCNTSKTRFTLIPRLCPINTRCFC